MCIHSPYKIYKIWLDATETAPDDLLVFDINTYHDETHEFKTIKANFFRKYQIKNKLIHDPE